MASRRELTRQATEDAVINWMRKHSGRFYRIPDVASAVNRPTPAVNNALRSLSDKGEIQRETRRKRINGKQYPVYQYVAYAAPEGPSWLCPKPPEFTPEQIKGLRTVLGFTGNVEVKRIVGGASIVC